MSTCNSHKKEILPPCKRIIVIGDLHGDWEVTKQLFLKFNIIDTNNRWIAQPRDTKIVQVGDILDRGGRPDTIGDECSELKIMDFLDRFFLSQQFSFSKISESCSMLSINK